MNVKMKIGHRVKELRLVAKMSQKDVAYAADLDRSYFISIEKGGRNISIINIEKITVALNITLQEFFNNDDFNKHARGSK